MRNPYTDNIFVKDIGCLLDQAKSFGIEIKEIALTMEQIKVLQDGCKWTNPKEYGMFKSVGEIGYFFGIKITGGEEN